VGDSGLKRVRLQRVAGAVILKSKRRGCFNTKKVRADDDENSTRGIRAVWRRSLRFRCAHRKYHSAEGLESYLKWSQQMTQQLIYGKSAHFPADYERWANLGMPDGH